MAILIAVAAAGLLALFIYRIRRNKFLARQRAERKLRHREREAAWQELLRDLD